MNYKDKYFSIMGDSISTLEGYIPQGYAVFYDRYVMPQAGIYSPADTWWGKVIDGLGGKLLANNSWSGSLVCMHPEVCPESAGCSDERTSMLGMDGIKPDVIIIYLGTNDRGYCMPVEPNAETGNSLIVYSVAYSAMLAKIRQNYPDAEVWCMSIPKSRCDAIPGFIFPERIYGMDVRQYNAVTQRCALQAGCRFIDMFNTCEPYPSLEGLHPNAAGMTAIAEAVLKALSKA